MEVSAVFICRKQINIGWAENNEILIGGDVVFNIESAQLFILR